MGENWAMEEMKRARLGDPRRQARAARILEQWAEHPESTIPEASADASQTKLTYRFLATERIEAKALARSHAEATLARIAEQAEVWIGSDSTSLDFTGLKATQGLGPLESAYTRGLFLHSALAMSVEGVPLGLLSQTWWAREEAGAEPKAKAKTRRAKTTDKKESAKWFPPLEVAAEIAPHVRVLLIGDREADIYDLFAHPRAEHVDLRVRAAQNRRVVGEEALLWDGVRAAPLGGVTEVEVGRARERPPRVARLEVRFREVEVDVPRHAKARASKKPVRLWAIHVRETDVPAGEKALEWKLLTTREVVHLEQALTLVRAYAARWKVERFHYTLKSGCQVEHLQLETAARLERALALIPQVERAAEVVITEAVFAEVANALSGTQRLRQVAATFIRRCYIEPNMVVVPVDTALLTRALDLFESRADKEWGLTDCISFVVMRDRDLLDAATGDRHFKQAGFRALMLETEQ